MSRFWRRIVLAGSVGCFGCCMFGCGLAYGLLYQTGQLRQEQFARERELIEPLLASDPALADLRCEPRSNGGVYLLGDVPTRADRDRLRERLTRLVGEGRAGEILTAVSARQ